MKAKQSGARYGKDRHTHHRSRTARLHARNAIHEYLEPEPELGYIQVERSIPIRRRSDFIQGVAICTDNASDDSTGDGGMIDKGMVGKGAGVKSAPQLELAFEGEATEAEVGRSGIAVVSNPLAQRLSIRSPAVVEDREPEQNSDSDGGFTVGGFIYGCALGGAAAAVILMVVQLAVL